MASLEDFLWHEHARCEPNTDMAADQPQAVHSQNLEFMDTLSSSFVKRFRNNQDT